MLLGAWKVLQFSVTKRVGTLSFPRFISLPTGILHNMFPHLLGFLCVTEEILREIFLCRSLV